MKAIGAVSAIAVTLLGSVAVLAQGQTQQPQHPMTFFIASTVPGTGNLGGLAGADRICQNLAQAVGAGNHTWRAYLSQQATATEPAINARARIGAGPWYNAKGVLIASNVGDLHGDVLRDRNNVQKTTALTEKGGMVHGVGDMPNEHDMLTGSDSDGRAWPAGFDTTCNNWTSDGTDHKAMLGHSDRSGGGNVSWNSAHLSRDCTKAGLIATGGAGHFYCFAIN
ncbi:MAG TPA: hypothetical protein VGZ26_03905 [Pirellulales bacterium]|nr:hypothetical protein [Pirellulales bacterium]